MKGDSVQEAEAELLAKASKGDDAAFTSLVEPLRPSLFSYIYRMVTHRENAEDLLQETLIRVLESLPKFRRESRFKTWLFGIATHICLDHLRQKKRWRTDAQLRGEEETIGDAEALETLANMMAQPDFQFEIREHIAFCFSCIARTLSPEEQAAIMLREVLDFTAQEAAGIMDCSEPVFRHRLSSARKIMIEHYDNLCQLINKTGICYQCKGLREFAPAGHQGSKQLVKITVGRNKALTPENLFTERLRIVREADLENGGSKKLHTAFFDEISSREEREA